MRQLLPDLVADRIRGPLFVRRANDTDWGLVGYVFTRSLDRALRVSERLEVGMVGLNTGLVSNPAAPFGGVSRKLPREAGAGAEAQGPLLRGDHGSVAETFILGIS